MFENIIINNMHANFLLKGRLEAHCTLYRHSALGFRLLQNEGNSLWGDPQSSSKQF